MQTHAPTHKLSLSHHTLTPMRALHRCLHLSPSLSWKKKKKKKVKITPVSAGSDPSCLSFFFPVVYLFSENNPASVLRCLCAAAGLHIPTRGLSNGSPLIFLSCPLLLSLLTSLQCSSSQLSFPAVCLSTASPSSFSFLPPLSHFCLPAPCL